MPTLLTPTVNENVYFAGGTCKLSVQRYVAAGNERESVDSRYGERISWGEYTIEEKVNYAEVYARVGSGDVVTNIFIGWIDQFKDLCIHGVEEVRVDSKRGVLRVYVRLDELGVR